MEKTRIEKIENALKYYLSMTALKDVERTGWNDWGVKRNRIESVAEHVFGTQQLAIAIWSEFELSINIDKVITMLAVHETEEPVIGDIPLVHDLKEYKKDMGKIAVKSLTEPMTYNKYIRNLVNEFEEQKTPEAKYAKFIDKLECDIQSKLYSEENTVDLNHQETNASYNHPLVQKLLGEGKSFGEMWMEFGRNTYNYPIYFNNVSEYAEENNLHSIRENNIYNIKQEVNEYLNTVRK